MDSSEPTSKSTVIPFRKSRPKGLKVEKNLSTGNYPLVFLYTIDLLMEDFGKKHEAKRCVLCEPMKVAGLHRDKVMLELAVALFKIFFPSFENYVLEIRSQLVEGLLDRRDRKVYPSVKDKIKALLTAQIQADLKDFIQDMIKHLQKYSLGVIESERIDKISAEAFQRLQVEWMS